MERSLKVERRCRGEGGEMVERWRWRGEAAMDLQEMQVGVWSGVFLGFLRRRKKEEEKRKEKSQGVDREDSDLRCSSQ